MLASISLHVYPHSVGQSDKALLARVQTLEQEKAMLSEQVQSAQTMLRSYLEPQRLASTEVSSSASIPDSEHTQVS